MEEGCALSVFTTHHSLPCTQSLEGVSLLPVGVTIPTSDGEVIMASSANICCATAGEKGEGYALSLVGVGQL